MTLATKIFVASFPYSLATMFFYRLTSMLMSVDFVMSLPWEIHEDDVRKVLLYFVGFVFKLLVEIPDTKPIWPHVILI